MAPEFRLKGSIFCAEAFDFGDESWDVAPGMRHEFRVPLHHQGRIATIIEHDRWFIAIFPEHAHTPRPARRVTFSRLDQFQIQRLGGISHRVFMVGVDRSHRH
jgi:hypothetical protein